MTILLRGIKYVKPRSQNKFETPREIEPALNKIVPLRDDNRQIKRLHRFTQ